MSGTDAGPRLSRRQFLVGCGTIGATAVGVPAVRATQERESSAPPSLSVEDVALGPAVESLGIPGDISPDGKAAIADVDDQLAQQGGSIERTVDAVEDLGLNPSGGTPINAALEAAVSSLSNVRVEFPSDATFRLTDRILLNPTGPVELVGNGATLKLDANTEAMAFDCPNLPDGTRISGFTIDQTAQGSVTGVRVGSEGTVEVRDVTVQGYSTPTPSIAREGGEGTVPAVLMPIARSPSSTVRITNFTAIGGTAAGMHSDPDKPESAPENRLGVPMGMWVGQSSTGTVQLVNPRMRGWSNGTYSARTPAIVQILGGVLGNNSNTQARVGGGSVIDGTTMILDDRQWSKKKNPGPYTLGGNQGVHAVRVETGGDKGNQSDPVRLRNLDIRGLSMEISSSLINFEGSAPAGTIMNCRITNHIDVPSLLAVAPGSQGSYGAAAQTNVLVDQCLLTGSTSASVIEVDDRPNSRIQRTCIKIPGASAESIDGMQIGQSVGFGKTCSAGGLSNSKKVGSAGNVNSLPAPTGSSGASGRQGPSKGVLVTVLGGTLMLVSVMLGMLALFVVGILGALGALAGLVGGD